MRSILLKQTLIILAIISIILAILPDNPALAASQPPSFSMSWGWSDSSVQAGQSFTLDVRIHNLSGPGDHGGVSVSFPNLDQSGASSSSFSSSKGGVIAESYSTGLSQVYFFDVGDMITSSSGSQIPASHLLVETDDSSWPSNADRTLRLRVTPKVPGTFTIKLRGWICASGYSNVSRTGGPTTDQQGWQAQLININVTPQTGNLVITVNNFNNSPAYGLGGTTQVILYNGSFGSQVGAKTIDSQSKVSWTGLTPGTYSINVYHQPGTGLNAQEFWGGSSGISVAANSNTNFTYTRHTQWMDSFPDRTGTQNQPVTMTLKVRNGEAAAHNVKVRMILDRDQAVPYDFDQTSSAQSVPANGLSGDFSFSFTPTATGSYYGYYIVSTSDYFGSDSPTDQGLWTQKLVVSSAVGGLRLTIYNSDGTLAYSLGGTTTVKLWSGNYASYIGSSNINSSSQVLWSGLTAGSYTVEVNHVPGLGLNETELWGASVYTVQAGTISSYTYTRHTQWIADFPEKTATQGQSVTMTIKLQNGESYFVNARIRLILDRDQSAPYDFDQTSTTSSIPTGGTSGNYNFNFTPSASGTYYAYAVIQGYYNSQYSTTDQLPWTQKLVVAPADQYIVSYGLGVYPDTVLLYDRQNITLTITNTGSSTIPNLGIGLDIHDPNGKKVENTKTNDTDPETGKIGRIDFDYIPSDLAPGESWTFQAEYIFGTSVMGNDYQPGSYTFRYYAWAGGKPGDPGATPIGELQIEPVTIGRNNMPAVDIPILMYHKIDDDSPSEYWVTVDNFHAQMELLHNLGYESITYDELRNYMLYGDALPAKPVIINLDDAYQNAYTKAKPILDEFGFIGVVNIPTGYIGNTEQERQTNNWDPPEYAVRETSMLIWPELDNLRDAGWSIQSHSVTHPDMTTLTDIQIRTEIIESRDTIQDKLNEQPQYFCYPYGSYNSRVKQILQEEGYLGAISVVSGVENTATANLYELKRIYIKGTDTINEFWGYLGSSPRPRILNVPYYNQFNANWCWATSLSMILRYYGYERKPWEIAADFNKPKTGFWGGLNGFDTYFILENYLEEWYDGGSSDAWKGETFYAFDGLEALVNRMKEVLSQGHPVWLACWDAAHAIVAVGFDGNADSDHVFIHDPSGAITDPQNGSQVIYHKYTWEEFKDAIDQELISPLGEVVALYAQTSALSGHSTKASIEIAPFMLTFYNGMGGELQFDWDGSEPYEGYRYEPFNNAAGWYSQDTDSKYHNYGFNASHADKMLFYSSYANNMFPGQSIYLRTRAEIRRADNDVLITNLVSDVTKVDPLTWEIFSLNSFLYSDLRNLDSGVYKLLVIAEGNEDNGTSFSPYDQAEFYFGVYGHKPPVIGTFNDTPDPVVHSETVALTAIDVFDPDNDGEVIKVEFYRDANDNGMLEAGTDNLLGVDTDWSDGWNWTGSTADFPLGLNTYFAQAQDNEGLWSNVVSTSGFVKSIPQTPVPLSPEDNGVIATLVPVFEWSPFNNGGDGETQTGYQLRVRYDTDGDIIVYDTGFIGDVSGHNHQYAPGAYTGVDPITNQEKVSQPLEQGKHYHWHVRYRDSGGDWSLWSADTLETHQDFFIELPGSITINPEPGHLNAPWSLTFPNDQMFDGIGDQTIDNLDPGNYKLTWGSVNGWITPSPNPDTKNLPTGGFVVFTGTYTQQPGTITINAEPDSINAPWSITGPGYSTSGNGDKTLPNLDPGNYTLTWSAVAGWDTPSPNPETKVLTVGGSVIFAGTYTPIKETPALTTNPATDITATSATFHGNLDSLGSYTTINVSFEWGETPGGPYPNETEPEEMNAPGAFSFDLAGLTPSTPYYYRAKTVGVIIIGEEQEFITTGGNTPPTAPVVNVTPDLPVTDDDLVCTVTTESTDPDDDTITYTYEWYKDDVLQPDETTATTELTDTLPSALTGMGETWKCVVTPDDGTVDGPSAEDQVIIVAASKTETITDDALDAIEEADTEVEVDGSANITVAKYADNPGTGFGDDIGKYVDVHIDNDTDVTEIEIRLYYTDAEITGKNESTLKLQWWDSSTWVPCSDTGVNTDNANGYSGYIWAKIRNDTTPNLAGLSGTPFGAGAASLPSPPITPEDGGGSSSGGGGGGGGGASPGYTNITEYITSIGRFTKEVIAISSDGKVELNIPKDTIGLNRVGQPLYYLLIEEQPSPPDPPADCQIIGLVYDFGPHGTTFDPPASLTYTYNPDDLPEGVNEENLVIAYWDNDASEWIVLEGCVVDTVNHTVTAPISCFSQYAMLAYTRPAAFNVSDLTIDPAEITIGNKVAISVIVTNTGDLTGSYEVSLNIDNVVAQSQEIVLYGGASQKVSFSVTPDTAGEHTIHVCDLLGKCIVKAPEAPLIAPPPPGEVLAPVSFTISDLSVTSSEVRPAEQVTISAVVTNTGGREGSYTVALKINGTEEAKKEVTLEAGESETITFSIVRDIEGSYAVDIDGMVGEFTVIVLQPALPKPVEALPVKPPTNWWLIGGIIFGCVVIAAGLLVYFFVWRKRGTPRPSQV